MKTFYTAVLGLDLISEDNNKIMLGKNKHSLVNLHESSKLQPSATGHAGLYHFAILYKSRGDLAKTVYRILKQTPRFFSGSADHLVSEAFYFTDPEGNGIELYYDRDRTSWEWENGQVKMASVYIDPAEYIRSHINSINQNAEITMGHFHLKVGDIQIAKVFYGTILGFDITAELPGALFLSVGGYHHHIGLNTWESGGAGKRPQSLGLKAIEFFLPDAGDIAALKDRLKEHKIEYTEENNALTLHDPWGNEIRVKSE